MALTLEPFHIQVPGDLPPAVLVHHVGAAAGEQDHRGALVLRLRHRHPLRRLHQGQLRPEPVHQRGIDSLRFL